MMLAKNAVKYQAVLVVIGLIISGYLTAYHYFGGVPLACSDNGVVDCAAVLVSPYASLFGIPVALFGVLFFVIAIALLVLRSREYLLYWNTAGFLFLFYLWFTELALGKICIYCTAVHAVVILLFFISLFTSGELKE
ncbi:MAG: vitamin K epoxide reductase family protein [Candidatus Micrarchaeota archaeon]|nr:vitamin K epoxide reductase family protein [Candidatus Micrarchaeota archaeon]MDE1848152.1 vitamin K epoxide reductase family protein [Candidatus Micrarchaeota archaeon]MDE1864112.1 vitamin K epoxide reductase family protein [Candidatus Micrarchaeota archaeon]